MRTVSVITAVVGLLALPLAATAETPKLAPGQWETTATSVIVGTPFSPPPQTAKTCLTQEQIKHPWAQLQASKNQHCKFTDVKVHGNSATWQMECDAQGGHMTGKGKTTYTDPKHMQGVAHMVTQSDGQQLKIDVHTVGHWVSASCSK